MSSTNFHKLKQAFRIEEKRAKLAREKKLAQLQRLYSKSYPEISGNNTSKLWDYLNIDGKLLIQSNPMETDRLASVAKAIIGDNLSILNIGFGSANLEEKYFQNNRIFKWCGIDISIKSVKQASKKYPMAEFKIGDIRNIKYKKNSFDYVIALEVLEHIKPKDLFKSLNGISRVLKLGGYAVVSVPLNEGLEEMIYNGENPNAHVRVYTPDLIKAELEIAGFKILKEKKLFAFHKYYKLKTFLAKYLFKNKFKPNNLILVAQKPGE